MAPHLTSAELDFIHEKYAEGMTPILVHKVLKAQRGKKNIQAPHLTNLRKVLKGKRYRRGRQETRGKMPKYYRAMVLRMDQKRKELINTADNQREVRWEDVRRSARVPKGHRTTLKRAFSRENIPVAARRPREKPQRTAEHEAERYAFAKEMAAKPPSYYINSIDMIIDNKAFDIPTTERARKYQKSQHIRFHLRTPAEGIKNKFTKPGRKNNRMNTGAKASVCAGISNGRIVLWHYLKKTWNGEAAAELYNDVIYPTLKRVRGLKRWYRLLEDNDPTGYKSNAAKTAKRETNIKALVFPRYSPDINPLDFSIWHAVEAKMMASTPKKIETVAEYKKRLRLTALRLPRAEVTKAVGKMSSKIRELKDARGGNIPSD